MKMVLSLLLAAVCIGLIVHSRVNAHESGQPYIKINDEYVSENAILAYTEVAGFSVGADIGSPAGYLVNSPIKFEIDEHLFPNPFLQVEENQQTSIASTDSVAPQFLWDFKDGTEKREGAYVEHSYTKLGTYIIELAVKYPGKAGGYAIINTIQLSIIPNNEYELPRAKISVNGRIIENPAREILDILPGQKIALSADASFGKDLKYIWSLEEKTTLSDVSINYRYKSKDQFPVYPVLRVTDSSGISSDTFAILDTPLVKPSPFIYLWMQISNAFADFTAIFKK